MYDDDEASATADSDDDQRHLNASASFQWLHTAMTLDARLLVVGLGVLLAGSALGAALPLIGIPGRGFLSPLIFSGP